MFPQQHRDVDRRAGGDHDDGHDEVDRRKGIGPEESADEDAVDHGDRRAGVQIRLQFSASAAVVPRSALK